MQENGDEQSAGLEASIQQFSPAKWEGGEVMSLRFFYDSASVVVGEAVAA